MDNKLKLKIALLIISSFFIFFATKIFIFYNGIFRLSSGQVQEILKTKKSSCQKINECELKSGDILIRRYITSRTWLIDKIADPYFTHSAFYLGNDQIVEAVGTEKNPTDEIQIAYLSKSDWFDENKKDWVILRPIAIAPRLKTIKSNLVNIAENPDYHFGISESKEMKATCADLIFKQLRDEKIISDPDKRGIITPDYLFWLTVQDQSNFEVIGYSFSS